MNRLLLLLSLFTCKILSAQTLQLNIRHEVSGKPMLLDSTSYLNAMGETFSISVFKYYLSNFSLTTQKGQKIILPAAYFLISEDSAASKKIILKQLPAGTYSSISFMIGVDSIMNFSGAQGGALDPVHGMFWTWNSGYIMAKLEGTSPVTKHPNHVLQFHIGGYRAPHITQRTVTLELPRPLVIQRGQTVAVTLAADAASWFGEPFKISFREYAGFMSPGTVADRIADNYQHMFSVKGL
ncbi:MbnP family protein [Chitinophaga tropicalis]|uniref:Copper-binding protein MbnP-like domain-containing protein n=1 Tax=Chitinophaga tropicalis TaxID=2683588 RepID=A0A7K1U6X3_9BACT|nr:MbnP family protein [Chitinophaga tropicalis]MVT10108.1 hypothetical protein [Chitinophaga tropicalis]